MTARNLKLYPIGIQTFEVVRREDRLYVDKTELVYRMTHDSAKYVFLSRPRRFGKSLLVSTLKSYFEGRRDLFAGLAIEKLEKEWTAYAVLHFSMAGGKHMDRLGLERYLDERLKEYERKYGITHPAVDPNDRLAHLIRTAYEQTGRQVVVLIDEYDAPLLDVAHEDSALPQLRQVMRNFYSPLKDADPYLRFVFLTGITKFSQLSIFSELNNIKNISMMPEYAALCGISLEEVNEQMHADVAYFAQRLNLTSDQAVEALRHNYDGYHFAWPSPDIFNPFSLLNALHDGQLQQYWFSTGTPTYLLEMMRRFEVLPSDVQPMQVRAADFDAPTEYMQTLMPLLYQSGYLTIKDYDSELSLFTLDIPNREIRIGLFNSLLPNYVTALRVPQGGVTIAYMSKYIREGDIDRALHLLQDYLGTVPYCNVRNHEGHYQQMLFIIFTLLTQFLVDVEVHTPHGRVDMVLMTTTRIYLFEFKLNRDAQSAMRQMDLRNYRQRFALSGLPVTKVAINFDSTKGNLTDWMIE